MRIKRGKCITTVYHYFWLLIVVLFLVFVLHVVQHVFPFWCCKASLHYTISETVDIMFLQCSSCGFCQFHPSQWQPFSHEVMFVTLYCEQIDRQIHMSCTFLVLNTNPLDTWFWFKSLFLFCIKCWKEKADEDLSLFYWQIRYTISQNKYQIILNTLES